MRVPGAGFKFSFVSMSMLKRVPTYWLYQMFGWGVFVLINMFFAYTFDKFDDIFIYRMLAYIGMGVMYSHIMRYTIKKFNLLMQPLQQQLVNFVLVTVLFAFLVGISETYVIRSFGLQSSGDKKYPVGKIILNNA